MKGYRDSDIIFLVIDYYTIINYDAIAYVIMYLVIHLVLFCFICVSEIIDNIHNKGLATRIATNRQSSLRLRDLLCNLCASIVIDTATRHECSALSFPVLLFRYPVIERNYSCNQYRS